MVFGAASSAGKGITIFAISFFVQIIFGVFYAKRSITGHKVFAENSFCYEDCLGTISILAIDFQVTRNAVDAADLGVQHFRSARSTILCLASGARDMSALVKKALTTPVTRNRVAVWAKAVFIELAFTVFAVYVFTLGISAPLGKN